MSANVVDPLAPSFSTPPLELVIRPRRGWIAIDWAEMVRYRELLYFLIWRDVKVRYKQTVLGFAWAVIQPLLNALIAAVIFGSAAGFQKLLPTDVPYLLFSFVGQLPWQLFATGLSMGGMSLMNQQSLLTKIYFPRLFLPTSSVGGALVDFLISFSVMGAFMIVYHFSHYHFTSSWSLLMMPLLIIPTAIAALGVAYLLSAVTVVYRDFRFLIPFMSQIWMQVSFVMLPRELIIQHSRYAGYEWILALNPMYGIIESYRHLVLKMSWNPMHLVIGTLVACAMCIVGMFYFRKTERRFADIA
jgi:lipopolysaccharide transport system permease protein